MHYNPRSHPIGSRAREFLRRCGGRAFRHAGALRRAFGSGAFRHRSAHRCGRSVLPCRRRSALRRDWRADHAASRYGAQPASCKRRARRQHQSALRRPFPAAAFGRCRRRRCRAACGRCAGARSARIQRADCACRPACAGNHTLCRPPARRRRARRLYDRERLRRVRAL